MKISDISGHLQLVLCLYLDLSENKSTLEKVAKLFPALKNYRRQNVKKHPTLTKGHAQNIGHRSDFKVSMERQYPNLLFGTKERDECQLVWL